MTAKHLYQVREFAEMAGVTVRTLQYYDRIGVLEPTDKTDAQHRLYERKDLLKLQQILTLKQLGFSLKEIKQMIHHPNYDLREALEAQKRALDDQIQQLQAVSSAMAQAMDVLDATDTWDWDTVQTIIQGTTDRQYLDWIRQYFSDEQVTQLMNRASQISPQELQQSQEKWRSIALRLRQYHHLSPDHPTVQAIAEEANELIEAFTQGDDTIHQSLEKMYAQPENIPPAYRVFDDDLWVFYQQVMDVYQQNNER